MKARVGVIQFDPRLGCVDENVATLERLVEQAAEAGAVLLVAPEMATTGYLFVSRQEALPFAEPVPGPTTQKLQRLCARLGVYLIVGLLERDGNTGFLYNTAAVIGPSGYLGKYRKTHPFLADTRWAVDGNLGFPVFDLPFGRVGVMVCMDVSYFEAARMAAVQGAAILAFPLNSRQPAPTEQWSVRAAENGVYLLAANRTGFERGTRFSGGSSVLSPAGVVLATVQADEGFAVADVDTSLRDRDSLGFGAPVAGRRPSAYYPLMLSPYRWSAPEVFNLQAEGCPGIVAASAAGAPDTLRRACEDAWQEFARVHRSKPDVIVLPERALREPGGAAGAIPSAEAIAWGAATAEALGSSLAFGFEELATDGIWNSMMLVTPQGESHLYRQVHVAPADDGRIRPSASGFRVVDLPWGRVGLALGADLFYPETMRCLAQKGADAVLAGIERDPAPLTLMLRERARSNNTHIVVAAALGLPRVFLAEDQPGQPEVGAAAVLYLSQSCGVRTKPSLQKRRPELYERLCL